MQAVIVAAGRGSRLMNDHPKTLLLLGKDSILKRILSELTEAGVDRIVIVLGYEARKIEDYLARNDYFGMEIVTVFNPEWQRGNGLSVLSAEPVLKGETFILSMSDHLVSPRAVQKLVKSPRQANLLLIDSHIDRVFDIEDATKVLHQNGKLLAIGKELMEYNAIDCGVFRLKSEFFEAMRRKLRDSGEESISAAVNELIAMDDMEGILMDSDQRWIDIDTPAAYNYARENLHLFTQ